MNHLQSYSDHYFIYHSLDTHSKVKYYLDKIKNNDTLDYYEKLEISIDYTIALFEIGKYEKFLYIVDEIIEKVIEENIGEINGVDVFEVLLFKKAASHYNLEEYDAAIYVLRQLVNINPKDYVYKNLLSRAVRRDRQKKNNGILQPITVLCFVVFIIIKVADIFIIEPFYYAYHLNAMIAMYTFLISGVTHLVISYARFLIERYK